MADEDIKLLGGLSGKQEILAEAEARDIPFLKKISMSYNAQTALSGIAQKVQRETIPAAPGFDPTQDEIWNEYKTRVPKELHNELAGAGSRGEMDAIVDDYQRTEDYNQKLSRSGYSGIGASLAGASKRRYASEERDPGGAGSGLRTSWRGGWCHSGRREHRA